ncbi:conserved hypothetical protein [Histoplasma capsulatum var. duboisii H88]|uniref:Uncharacterized protein n=1 Tax=Ajellomyces capsulatus (strain H88) TaxID=544711 RepID=F0UA12_AJEC8|nr:conserved hypothetical protein [Histoplasma capsulatum var. duboisii H88]
MDHPYGTASVPERPKPMESYYDQEKPGPVVRDADGTDCAMPWTVASTDGCGEQLFSRIMDAGSVKVRDKTCKNSTTTTEIHTKCQCLALVVEM